MHPRRREIFGDEEPMGLPVGTARLGNASSNYKTIFTRCDIALYRLQVKLHKISNF